MALPIYVDAYPGCEAIERPRQFQVDEDTHEIVMVEERWRSQDSTYLRLRTVDSKRYVIHFNEQTDEWTLLSDYDGKALFERNSIEVIPVGPDDLKRAVAVISGCERCRPNESDLLFDWILADVMHKPGPFEFLMAEAVYCPRCNQPLSEKSIVESDDGMEVVVVK